MLRTNFIVWSINLVTTITIVNDVKCKMFFFFKFYFGCGEILFIYFIFGGDEDSSQDTYIDPSLLSTSVGKTITVLEIIFLCECLEKYENDH